jgi:hypothetical protein
MTARDPRLIGIEIRLAEEAMKFEPGHPESAGALAGPYRDEFLQRRRPDALLPLERTLRVPRRPGITSCSPLISGLLQVGL